MDKLVIVIDYLALGAVIAVSVGWFLYVFAGTVIFFHEERKKKTAKREKRLAKTSRLPYLNLY